MTKYKEFFEGINNRWFSGFTVSKFQDGNFLVEHGLKLVVDELSSQLAGRGVVGGSGQPKFVQDHLGKYRANGEKLKFGVILTPENLEKIQSSSTCAREFMLEDMINEKLAKNLFPGFEVNNSSDGNIAIKQNGDVLKNLAKQLGSFGIKGHGGNDKFVAKISVANEPDPGAIFMTKKNIEELINIDSPRVFSSKDCGSDEKSAGLSAGKGNTRF